MWVVGLPLPLFTFAHFLAVTSEGCHESSHTCSLQVCLQPWLPARWPLWPACLGCQTTSLSVVMVNIFLKYLFAITKLLLEVSLQIFCPLLIDCLISLLKFKGSLHELVEPLSGPRLCLSACDVFRIKDAFMLPSEAQLLEILSLWFVSG